MELNQETEWYADIEQKLKRKNKLLFSRDSRCLQELLRLIEMQKHRTLVMWALDCGKVPLEKIQSKYPAEARPAAALELCGAWARGEIKMPAAKRAILDAHAVAKEVEDAAIAARCHAVGHAGATVHVETHAIGLPIYELTAIVLENEDYREPVAEKIRFYYQKLLYWQAHIDAEPRPWAAFLLDDARPNKEKLLRASSEQKKREAKISEAL